MDQTLVFQLLVVVIFFYFFLIKIIRWRRSSCSESDVHVIHSCFQRKVYVRVYERPMIVGKYRALSSLYLLEPMEKNVQIRSVPVITVGSHKVIAYSVTRAPLDERTLTALPNQYDINVHGDLVSWIESSINPMNLGAPTMVSKAVRAVNTTLREFIQQDRNALRQEWQQHNPYSGVVAHGRLAHLGIPEDERRWVQERLSASRGSLEAFLGRAVSLKDENLPRIALAHSGGGFRAMIGSFCAEKALSAMGLEFTYRSGVSGGTWAMINSHHSKEEMRALVTGKPFVPGPNDALIGSVQRSFKRNFAFDSPYSPTVDLFGAMLTRQFELDVYRGLSSLAQAGSESAFPIFTAAQPTSDSLLQWEFTPFEAYGHGQTYRTPVWAFGRHFENGVSTESDTPEIPVGAFLGIFGSAFCATIHRTLQQVMVALHWSQSILNFGRESFLKFSRKVSSSLIDNNKSSPTLVAPKFFWNPSFDSKSSDEPYISLVDAGIHSNLPIVPLLDPIRAVDVIVVLDHSRDLVEGGFFGLKTIKAYAEAHGLHRLPDISTKSLGADTTIAVFGSESQVDSKCVIIYITQRPFTLDKTQFDPAESQFTRTTNFSYKGEQFDTMDEHWSHLMRHHIGSIKQVIDKVVEHKEKAI